MGLHAKPLVVTSQWTRRSHLLPQLVPAFATAIATALVAGGAKPIAAIGLFVVTSLALRTANPKGVAA